MTTLLLSMLLACDVSGWVEPDKPHFEAGTYSCGFSCGSEDILFTIEDDGIWTRFTFEGWHPYSDEPAKKGECVIIEEVGDTPGAMWWAECDGLEDVFVYSEGFRMEVEWIWDEFEPSTEATFE